MRQELFTVAEYIRDYGGKLVIIGTFDLIYSHTFPFNFPPFGFAAMISADRRDFGKTYDAAFTLRKLGAKKPLVEVKFPLQFPQKQRRQMSPRSQGCAMIGPFTTFDSPGVYLVQIKATGVVVCEQRISVEELPAAPQAKVKPPKKKTKKKTKKKSKKRSSK